ncbi:hypothetical protein [Mitsuokella sp.]
MNGIMDTLARATHGKRYQSHKFCYDIESNGVIEYDRDREIEWLKAGESEHFTKPRDLTHVMELLSGQESWFKYFLDGSRHTYKVDDISYNNNVYPIIAGQVGVCCCKREHKKMMKEFFEPKLVISVPNSALPHEFQKNIDAIELLGKVNKSNKLLKHKLKIADILPYNLDADAKYESKGIAKIQDYMIEQEKKAVIQLVKEGKIKDKSYLLKDGSLEYKAVDNKNLNLSEAKMKMKYRYVLGVSKSFNPTTCFVEGGGTKSSVIAGLKKNERTPACCYRSKISGEGVNFCVWYLRLRESKYTQNVFDGIIKVEKLIQDNEMKHGVSTDLIDQLSAFLLRERNPVCYGKDKRWANHLYPIYVAESFAKSKYISTDLFLSLF